METLLKKDLYTPKEVAEYHSVSVKTIYLWINQGKFEIVKKGKRSIRIKKESINNTK